MTLMIRAMLSYNQLERIGSITLDLPTTRTLLRFERLFHVLLQLANDIWFHACHAFHALWRPTHHNPILTRGSIRLSSLELGDCFNHGFGHMA